MPDRRPSSSSGKSPSPTRASSSLWNRSKRALGGKNFTFLQHVPKGSEAGQSSGKSESESAKAAHTRRREQVRRAQRNHRERKENYIKSLEREVLRLRDEEAGIVQESKAVQEENAMLKEILTRNGISLPSHLQGMNPIATVSLLDQPDGGQRLQVTMPDLGEYSSAMQSFHSPFPTSLSTSSPGSEETTIPRFSKDTRMADASPRPEYPTHPEGLDAPQVGIDFVLSLERPCLGHTRGDPHGADSSGHALTAQAPLLSAAPAELSTSASWQIPAVEIERLLDLSANLNLVGEITPVQAWSRIRAYPGFEKMSRDRLEGLKFVLMSEVQCYGFGAVIDEGVLESILSQSFYGLS